MPAKITTLRRYGLALLGAATIAGCGSGGTDSSSAGTITLTFNPSAGTAEQGGEVITGATLTRGGDFTGTVDLTVTGAPAGVTATITNVVIGATATTARLTVTVAATTVPGDYTLVLHGTGDGVTEATADYGLTVTIPLPSFSLDLSPPALTIAQGSNAPATVTIVRSHFTGDVTLSALNLPTGVIAAFAPDNPQSGNSTVLTLTVASDAPVGTFTNLVLQGVGAPGTVSEPFALIVTPGPSGDFTLSTTPPTSVTVTQGANVDVTVNILRTGGNLSSIAITTSGTLPAGLSIALPPATLANTATLGITTTAATPVGSYPIVIHGNTAGLGEQVVNLTIEVVAP